MDSTGALLEEGLQKLNHGAKLISPLTRYIEEIELFNLAYGLVKVKDRRELIVRHILDSLAPAGIIRSLLNNARIADAGSGAGLPGIPLAICMPQVSFTLIERMGRRAGFLRDAAAVLGLSNVRVEEADIDKLRRNSAMAGGFGLVVFRAYRPLEAQVLKSLLNLLAPNGMLAAYKGRRETIEEELNRISRKNFSREIIPLDVPFLDEERHLLLMKRTP
jgi:16S rRNA (guanine527-N7)-methyltransferase